MTTGRKAPVIWGLLLVAALALVVGLSASGAGLAYGGIYALALVSGLPIGFRLFGARHAAGWIVGAALGYFLTALALWLAIALGLPSGLTFAGGWAFVTLAAWGITRGRLGPLIAAPAWTSRDTSALLIVLLLVPAIAGPPFIRLGAADTDGNRSYRAYFTADFVWHMAVTAEIQKFEMPPRNMFMPHRPLNYYWTYFVLPGAVAGAGPRALSNIENDLKVNAVGTAVLLLASVFIAAWLAVPRAWPVAGAVALTVVASSAEGLVEIVRLLRRGLPLSGLRETNIDAVSFWRYGGLRVDGLPRCFWWVPQHSMAYVLGLAAVAIASAAGADAPMAVSLIAGLAIAGSIAFNPFVGALFAVAWGLTAGIRALRSAAPISNLSRCAIAVVPAAGGLAWCVGNQMTGGAAGMLQFGLLGNARHAPIVNLLLSMGPVLIPSALGLALAVRAREAGRLIGTVALTIIALLAMHLMVLTGDDSWVGFRTGQLILVVAPALVAAGLAAPGRWRLTALTLALVVVCVGLPTTVIDEYNAQDTTNHAEGPGFPWTEVLDRAHADALDWLRRATPADAIVQLEPLARGPTTWSIIPSFAERRMAAGIPRTLVDDPEYHERSERVRQMYAGADAHQAWTIARALRINYVWVDEVERAAYPAGVATLDRAFEFFVPVFHNRAVTIYRVQ